MKQLIILLIIAGLLPSAFIAAAQDKATTPEPAHPSNSSFLQANTWWNLYFAKGHNPLQRGRDSINAVKILTIDKVRPAWVKITFPKVRKEHLSIIKPVAAAQDNSNLTAAEALAKWEDSVSDWQVMWVNLDYVERITKVETDGVTD